MSPLATQLVLAAPSAGWTKIILIGIFTFGLVLVILVPFIWDIRGAHKTWRQAVTADKLPPGLKHQSRPIGVAGVSRATMAFAVIVVIGFALGYILVEQPFGNDKTIVQNIIVALTTTLAAITAFYFGTKQASDINHKSPTPPPPTPPATNEPEKPTGG